MYVDYTPTQQARRYTEQARRYTEQLELESHPHYNPFRKIRSRYEEEALVLHRAQPLQGFPSPSRSDPVEENQSQELASRLELKLDEEDPKGKEPVFLKVRQDQSVAQTPAQGALELEVIHGSLDEEHGICMSPPDPAPWMSWSKRKLSHLWRQLVLASGSRRSGDVKQSVADMGRSVISHAPLGTRGAPFLQSPGRRKRFMVIEYAIKSTQGLVEIA